VRDIGLICQVRRACLLAIEKESRQLDVIVCKIILEALKISGLKDDETELKQILEKEEK
jgi:hypothetical protein